MPTFLVILGGNAHQLKAIVLDSDGNEVNANRIDWSSSNDEIATVSSNGIVSGKNSGSVTISATYENISGTANLEVVTPNN